MTDTEHGDHVKFTQDAKGEIRWTLRAAGNHEVIAASTESYVRRADAVTNLERVTGRKFDKWQESLG